MKAEMRTKWFAHFADGTFSDLGHKFRRHAGLGEKSKIAAAIFRGLVFGRFRGELGKRFAFG